MMLEEPGKNNISKFWLIFWIYTGLRAISMFWLGVGEDEAYYWVWSKHLAWGYYDHPPLVAFLIALSTKVFGDTRWAVHLVALVCQTGFIVVAYMWCRNFIRGSRIYWFLATLLVTPVFFIAGIMTLPDSALGVLWVLALYMIDRALFYRREKNSFTAKSSLLWIISGIVCGIAALSKYNALLIPCVIALYLIVEKEERVWFCRWEPYAALLAMVAVFSPVILWNIAHGGESFLFQLVERHQGVFSVVRFLKFCAAQAGYLGPLGFVLVAGGFMAYGKSLKDNYARYYRFVFWTSAPVVALFALNSFFSPFFKPHWPALGLLGGLMLVFSVCGPKTMRLVKLNIMVNGLVIAILYTQTFVRILPLNAKIDISNDLYGWEETAQVLKEYYEGYPVLTDRYQIGAPLSFALGETIFVLHPRRRSSFDHWQNPHLLEGRDVLFVTNDRYFRQPEAFYEFSRCELVHSIPVARQGVVVRTFYIYRCMDFKGTV